MFLRSWIWRGLCQNVNVPLQDTYHSRCSLVPSSLMARNMVPGRKAGFHEAGIKVSNSHKEQQLSQNVQDDLQEAAVLELSQSVVWLLHTTLSSHELFILIAAEWARNSWLLRLPVVRRHPGMLQGCMKNKPINKQMHRITIKKNESKAIKPVDAGSRFLCFCRWKMELSSCFVV